MELGSVIKVTRHDGFTAKESYLRLCALYGREALSYSEAGFRRREFAMERKHVSDTQGTGRQPDFSCSLAIERA
jgi:hypothetical protein